MAPALPDWVAKLTPAGPQGSELLAMERAKSQINVDGLSDFMFGREVLERQAQILKILQAEKVFDKKDNYFLGRVEKIPVALARAKRLRQLQVEHNWSVEELRTADSLTSEPHPYGLHATMFLVSYVWVVHVGVSGGKLTLATDHAGEPGDAGAKEALPRAGQRLQIHWLLRADGAGPRVECARAGDDGDVEPGGPDIRAAFADSHGVEVVDWIAGAHGELCGCHGAAHSQWQVARSAPVCGSGQGPEDA